MKQVLLVEDNDADARLMIEAFRSTNAEVRVEHIRDGEKVLPFLLGNPPYESRSFPDLILLDLNLPRKDGREILADIKSEPGLAHVPVIVMSNSTYPADIHYCYKLHANCYLAKPLGFRQTCRSAELIGEFWLNIVKTDREGRAAYGLTTP